MAKYTIRQWSKEIRDRDGKCLECGRTEDLHAHHIKPRSTHPELSFELSNGKTLCYGCHKAEHERNRPVRVRSNKPQRNTLARQNAYLLLRIEELKREVKLLKGGCQIDVDESTHVVTKKTGRCTNKKFCKWQ